MPTINKFEELQVWKLSRDVNNEIWKLIQENRFKNFYKFINQIHSASGSIMDNIAEGFERGTKGQFILFLYYAKGSCGELRSQLHRAYDQNFITLLEFEKLKTMVIRVNAMIFSMIKYLKNAEIGKSRLKS
jgi:four helix bundle protein